MSQTLCPLKMIRATVDKSHDISTKVHPFKVFEKLRSIDKLRYILEQSIYSRYLKLIYSNPHPLLIEYFNQVNRLVLNAKDYISDVTGLEAEILSAITNGETNPSKLVTLLTITEDVKDHLFTTNPDINFFKLINLLENNTTGTEEPEGDISLPVLVPSITTTEDKESVIITFKVNYLEHVSLSDTISGSTPLMTLTMRAANSFSNANNLLAFLANFYIGGSDTNELTVEELAYNSICGIPNKIKYSVLPAVANELITLFKSLYDKGVFNDNLESDIVPLLAYLNVDSSIINYLIKPVSEITGNEALAFANSRFSFLPDRMKESILMADDTTKKDEDEEDEEDTEEESTDTPDDTSADTEDENLAVDDPDSTEGDDLGIDDEEGDLGGDDSEEEEIERVKESTHQLIELAKDKITLTEYMYRQLVLERLIMIIKNPPANIPTLELLLMKKWVTCWIHMVSVASIKDYISRLSFKLMDVLPAKEGDTLTTGKD